jgi:predicted RNA binding protein YcfA (HicA-like mRNA interferase family)
MTRLPRDVSPLDPIKALEKAGFTRQRQVGSHVVMRREEPRAMTVVPQAQFQAEETKRKDLSTFMAELVMDGLLD